MSFTTDRRIGFFDNKYIINGNEIGVEGLGYWRWGAVFEGGRYVYPYLNFAQWQQSGQDPPFGWRGADRQGTDRTDLLVDGYGDNRLEGLGGPDALYGRDGNDRLIGGAGVDLLVGGDGDDVYVYSSGDPGFEAPDLIRDGGDGIDTIVAEGISVWINMDQFSRELTGIDRIVNQTRIPCATPSECEAYPQGYPGYAQIMGTDADNVLDFRGVALLGLTAINGLGGRDTIYGSEGRDVIYGGARVHIADRDDLLFGMGGDDDLFGGPGDDRLEGGRGNDSIDGGLGRDRAVYLGRLAEYEIKAVGSTWSVRDTVAGRDGSDTLTSIEVLVFSDRELVLA